MALQNKRSDTPGARANLIPGETAHNRADDALLLRGDGNRKIAVDLERWRKDAAPASGLAGAPLRRTAAGVEWAADLAPASMVADGSMPVDQPLGVYGVPGVRVTGAGDALDMTAGKVAVETFRVGADLLEVTAIVFNALSGAGRSVRVGIAADATGDILFEERFEIVDGLNVVAADLALSPGTYHLMIWAGGSLSLASFAALRADQGLDFDERTPVFTRRRTAIANLGAALSYDGLDLTAETSATPGEDHALLLAFA